MTDTDRLARVRVGVRAVLGLGIAASIAANVLHAQDNPIARVISAWPPGALFITVEVVSRVPVQTRVLSVARVGAAGVIAGIAAWVSYWHMVAVALRYGESPDSAHLLPLSVDGLVVVASVCLFEIGTRLRGGQVATVANRRPFSESAVYRWGRAVGRILTLADLRAWIGRRRSGSAPVAIPVAPAGIPDAGPASTPTAPSREVQVGSAPAPDSTDAPSLVPVGSGREPAEAVDELAVVADRALAKRIQRDIAAQRIKPNPGAALIGKTYRVGTDRARRVRDLLKDQPDEIKEAAHA